MKFMPLFAFLALMLTASCHSVDNEQRSTQELANYMMTETGAVWNGVREPAPYRADSAFMLVLNDRQILFAKYRTTLKKQKRWLEYVDENGFLYILGRQVPAIRSGSFVMFDYKEFPEEIREKLLDAFTRFE